MSILSISLLSLYVIAISLLVLVFNETLSDILIKSFSVTSIILSIFIVILTLLESGQAHQAKAHELHQCALDALSIYNKLQSDEISEPEARQLYDYILQKYTVNHDDIDYLAVKLLSPNDYDITKRLDLFKHRMQYYFSIIRDNFIYITIIFVPLLPMYYLIMHLVQVGTLGQ
jgi:hypothetical protein